MANERQEHEQQKFLMLWAARVRVEYPILDRLFAVPNGGLREDAVAASLKEEGVEPGIPDLLLLHPDRGYHGAAIEMKFGRNRPTDYQLDWLAHLEAEGFATIVAYSWITAARFLLSYLGADDEEIERLA